MSKGAEGKHDPPRPSLIEREEILESLVTALTLEEPDDAAIILLVGEIGVGKSEVLRTALEIAEQSTESETLRSLVPCHSGSSPYAPWTTLLEHHNVIRNAIPEPLGTLTPAAHGPNMLVQQAARTLCDVASERPMALIFDDIQRADSSSLDLLLAVAQQCSGLPLTLIMTCETPLREGEPVAQFVPALLRETASQSIELGPLSREGIRQVIEARYRCVDGELLDQLADHVARWSGGNALYLSEILAGIDGPDDICAALGTHRLDSLSFSLKHLAEHRLTQLSASSRETVELASIIGDVFDLDILVEVSGRDADSLIPDLEDALRAGILIEERDGRLRFRHGVVRQLLIETQSRLRRRQQHRAVLSALQRICGDRAPSLDIANHAEAAGELETAIDAFEQAGHEAVRFFNMPEAGQHYRKALELAEQANSDPARQDMLRLQYADSLVRRDKTAAIREFEKVATQAFLRGDAEMRGKALQRQATLLYEIGRRDEARDILEDLIPDLQQREEWQTLADALVCALYCAALDSDFGAVDILVQNLEAIFDKVDDAGYRALALAMKATADIARGRPGRAGAMIRDAARIMEEIGQLDIAAPYTAVAFMRVDLFSNLARPDQIQDLIAWGRRLDAEGNRRAGLPDRCDCTPEFALWYLLRGEWEAGQVYLHDPITVREEGRPQSQKDNFTIVGAEYRFAQGKLSEASEMLDYIAPTPQSSVEQHGYQPWLMAADLRARIAVATGAIDTAQEWVNALDRELEHKPHVPGELMLDLNRARISIARKDPEPAERIAVAVANRARQTQNMLALIDSLQLLGQARLLLGNREGAFEAVEEAIATARRCQLDYLEALCRITHMEIATGFDERSVRPEEIESLRQQMTELGAMSAAERLDALSRLRSNSFPGGLTKREIDVLAKIVEGKTDNEIAELLYISPRTVSTHVRNMLAKTNVINRVELVSWAHQNRVLN